MKKINIHPFVFFTITCLYLELIIKQVICKHIFNIGLLYTLIFLIPVIILFTLLSKAFSEKINKIITIITTLIITIYFEIHYIFYELFSAPFSFSTIGLADQALDFTTIIKDAILTHWSIFLAILVPFIVSIVLNRKIDNKPYNKEIKLSLFLMLITSYLSTFVFLIPNKEENNSPYKLYNNVDDATSIIDYFGMLTYTKVDIKRQLFGYESELIIEEPVEEIINIEEEQDYGDNILELNFDNSNVTDEDIKLLNNYFNNVQPTNKNEYTGMFKGKNLIFILAEGFNEIAVDEQRTPTLYKLTNNGFVFKDFYSPLFLSTTGGEFQATTGLIPTQETLKLWKSKTPTIEYALGNAFGDLGYRAQSFHNWTHTYYKRNLTMKTLGFDNYLGCGNGLENRISCKWLPSDIDMINTTTPDYLGKEDNFVTYYVTVSGHSPYNAGDNIAKKYFDQVENLQYSDPVKYYLASQIELDKMLENLINNLEVSGELDDTVIALVGDHYPYTLTPSEMNEVSNYEKDGTIEVNHSNFILWNNQIEEPIIVDKVGSQIDVLPTLLNLFGIEYDSRLIVGKDILSNYEGLAIFSNRSWVSDYGTYDYSTKTFKLKEGKTLENVSDYVTRINNRVSNSHTISKILIDKNYYSYILNK